MIHNYGVIIPNDSITKGNTDLSSNYELSFNAVKQLF